MSDINIGLSISYSDPAALDYEEVIRRAEDLLGELAAAYDAEDYKRGIEITKQIGELYAPSSESAAGRVAYLMQLAARELHPSTRCQSF